MMQRTMGWRAGALAVVGSALGVLLLGAPVQAQCAGDCNNDGTVAINELIIGVNIAQGSAEISACPSFDTSGDGTVAINELIGAVNNALNGCPPPVDTPTATVGVDDTPTATVPPVDTPTPTPTEVATVPPLGEVECNLGEGSELFLQTGALALPLAPTGSFSIACGETAEDGTASCECNLIEFGPVVIPGLGDVCVNSAAGCAPGVIDCDGGAPLDVDLDADHNIGTCSTNEACQTACDAHCASLGAGYASQSHGCEGWCLGGENDGAECLNDSDCPGASCPGRDPVTHFNTCNCTCAATGIGDAARAGSLQCNLGTQIDVELPSNGICGDTATIKLAPVCGNMTTENSRGVIRNANDEAGTTIPFRGAESVDGTNVTCEQFQAETIAGLKLVGQLAFYDSALGDIRSRNTFICQ